MEEILLPIHLLALAFCFITIIRSDLLGSRWIMGKVNTLDVDKVKSLHKQAWVGLLLMIASGAALFSQNIDVLINSAPFYVKMLSVLALVINAFVIGRLIKISTQKRFADTTRSEKVKLFVSGFVSVFFWIFTAIAALYILPEGDEAVLPIISDQSTTKTFTLADVQAHATEDSCYTTINGNVYDITKFISAHPGGVRAIMRVCGNDGTAVFMKKHGESEKPNLILRSMQIGTLSGI
jgi:cytochrome b involved in lipid metabolism